MFSEGTDMKNKQGVGIRYIETLATLPILLLICVISVPFIIYIGFKHLMYKIKYNNALTVAKETVEAKEDSVVRKLVE